MRFIKGVYATALFILTLGVFVAAPAFAQATRDSRVQVTVVDQSGGVIPGASVTLVGLETPTQAQAAPIATSGDNGIAILERMAPGRYSVRAEFPGFDLGLLRDIRVRAGDNRHVVVLPLAKLETSVTVGRNLQEVAADRRSSQFGNAVAQEQLDSLSDDPAELQRQLQELAGPDAVIRIDRLPGVGLRTLRGDGQMQLNARFTYAFVLGGGTPGAASNQARYRLNVFTNISNLTDHHNYGGYSGIITSPFYRTPTYVNNPRRVDVGMNLTF